MDPDMFDRLNEARLTCAQALEAHWAILAERRSGTVTDTDRVDPEWLVEHERLVNEAVAADAALVSAVQWSGPPPDDS